MNNNNNETRGLQDLLPEQLGEFPGSEMRKVEEKQV
jgi:hypothetical protein